jgi:hypothetical protein
MTGSLPLIEIIGYAGSVLVAISLMMSSIVRLRVLNLIGAAVFSCYGFVIGALPVGFLNGFIAIVDIYYLLQIFSAKEYFRVLEVKPGSEYLNYFLKFYEKDILKFIPTFSFNIDPSYHVMFILRDTVPAGLVCSEYLDDGCIFMKVDYVIPGYRDFKLGKFVFNEILKERKIKKVYSAPGNLKHEVYLQRMGFVKTTLNSETVYCLDLK